MKIIHFGDLHLWRRQMLWSESLYPKRWLGLANLCMHRAAHFPPAYAEAIMTEILKQSPDLAVFTGDFVSLSLPEEFAAAARLFAPLRARLGERLFAIPGNHDVYTPGTVRKGLLEKVLPWVHTGPVSRLDLTARLTVVGVNHAEPFLIASNGRVRPDTQDALRSLLNELAASGRQVILTGHFPYLNLPEFPESQDHQLLGRDGFRDLIREMKPALYLHGHQHIRWAVRSKETPETLCLNCGSAGMKHESEIKQAGFLSWEQQDDGGVQNLSAHVYEDGVRWVKTPLPVREI